MTLASLLKLIRKSPVDLGAVVLLLAGCTTAPSTDSDGPSDGGGESPDVECKVNDDCINSEEAEEASTAKCPAAEFFCQKGQCQVECATFCTDEDDPCEEGVCSTGTASAPTTPVWFCRKRAIACGEAQDCPTEPPKGYGGDAGDWSCDDHECAYPGVDYPTK